LDCDWVANDDGLDQRKNEVQGAEIEVGKDSKKKVLNPYVS
jgi:hypothetical protein